MLILGNLLFAAGFFGLARELFFWEKSSRKLQGLLWLSISVWSVCCIHVLIAAVLQAFTVFIGTLSIGAFDFAAAVLMHFVRRGKRQRYLWQKKDIWIGGLLFILTVVVGFLRFGIHLEMTYRSVDGITHYYEAFHVFESGRIKAMYFAALNNSFLVSFFAPFVKVTRLYHIEPIADMSWFYLSGITVFGFIREKCKTRFSMYAASFLGFFYLMGYPLNNLLMGFLYLGIGVTIAGVIFILTDFHMEDESMKIPSIVFLMLGCLGLITSYAFFVPPVFLAVFLALCIKRRSDFDYLPVLALAIVGFLAGCRKGKLLCVRIVFVLEFMYILILLYLSANEYVSAYYFYKNNYLFWLILHLLAVYAVANVYVRQTKIYITAACVVWLIPLAFSLLSVEEKLKEENEYLSPELHGGGSYCAVFRDNCLELRKVRGHNLTLYVSAPDKVELYEAGYELHKTEHAAVFPVSDMADRFFLNVVTNQWDLSYLNISIDEYMPRLKKDNPKYISVLKESDCYKKHREYLEQFPKIYENPSGFIAIYGGWN